MGNPHDGRQPAVAEQVLALLAMLVMVWFTMAPQERYWIRLQAVGITRRAAARMARAEGRAGMRDELAGHDPAARYGGAYALSRARDGLAGMLERMRP